MKHNIDSLLTDLDKVPEDPIDVPKKKKINGCRKGKCAERDLCHELEELFPCDVFRRVPMSGSFMGGFNFNKNMHMSEAAKQTLTGDLITPLWMKFSFESKAYNDTPQFHKILDGEDKELDKWIAQASCDASKVDKKFLLIFKITSKRKAFVCLEMSTFYDYCSTRVLLFPPANFLQYKINYIIIEKKVFFDEYLKHYKKVNDWFYKVEPI